VITEILSRCNNRFLAKKLKKPCVDCTYDGFCPNDCESCLDYIHTPSHAPDGAPRRKYDCPNMADFYTCKYSCRYTSELIYALSRLKDLTSKNFIKVLSFGCGPCTDLFALDYLRKNSDATAVTRFIEVFTEFANEFMPQKSYIVLNDDNFGIAYGGGREYFDRLFSSLKGFSCIKGRFHNEHSRSTYYPRGYPYGDDSEGEFPDNKNFFDLIPWMYYSPFDTCGSAQMLIKKEVILDDC